MKKSRKRLINYTGFSEQIDEKKAKAMGIKAFVMKPIVMSRMANTIREVLAEKDLTLGTRPLGRMPRAHSFR